MEYKETGIAEQNVKNKQQQIQSPMKQEIVDAV